MTFTPDPEKMRHYLPGLRPYVEYTISERKIHASLIGEYWLRWAPPVVRVSAIAG